jgi:SAM-dependent methyltransferase
VRGAGAAAGRRIGGRPEAVVWHDVECASYAADLALWRELAGESGHRGVLELGCGTGRVALDLAARGHDVTGLDADPDLVREFASRARARGLEVVARVGDARSFALGRRFGLVALPMQVVQLLGGPAGRAGLLRRVREHLEPGGLLAAALADPWEDHDPADALPPLPDMAEVDGWVVSSAPVAVRPARGAVLIDRVRQAVSPDGGLWEALATIRLDALAAPELEDEGTRAGFRALPARRVPETAAYVGSTVVLLEAPG